MEQRVGHKGSREKGINMEYQNDLKKNKFIINARLIVALKENLPLWIFREFCKIFSGNKYCSPFVYPKFKFLEVKNLIPVKFTKI